MPRVLDLLHGFLHVKLRDEAGVGGGVSVPKRRHPGDHTHPVYLGGDEGAHVELHASEGLEYVMIYRRRFDDYPYPLHLSVCVA
jgi:hypothetical protein